MFGKVEERERSKNVSNATCDVVEDHGWLAPSRIGHGYGNRNGHGMK
jgi:hypothetical protein